MESSVQKRFWAKVDKEAPNGCWEWTGARYVKGYGMLRVNGQCKQAHRLIMGEPEGLKVLHHCDNPCCVNPDHLYIGTASDNMRDMYRRNRSGERPKGEKHHSARLNWQKVREIRKLALSGVRNTVLAEQFGVSKVMVGKIVRNLSWKEA